MSNSRPPLVRMQYIDRMLKERRFPNCTGIARYFEVSTKSIQRDIEYMRDALNAPIAYDVHHKGYYYDKPGWSFFLSAILERREAEALVATRKVLAQYRGSPFYDELCRAIDKLRHYLPDNSTGNEFLDIYSLEQTSSMEIDPKMLARIEDAIRTKQQLLISYRAAWNREVTQRAVHPYTMHYSPASETWYIIGFCELRQDIRTFAIGRIRTLSVASKHFTIPKSFSIEHYLNRSFDQIHDHGTHEIAIRFTPHQAQWIRERNWHPTQTIEEHGNGGLTLKLKVGALEAVKRWVMRYGSKAQVLEPQELRKIIKYELLLMDDLYKDLNIL